MAQTIEIKGNSDNKLGSITFEENPGNLHVQRTASGFKLNVPIKISLNLVPEDVPLPMLSNLRGTIIAGDPSGPRMEIGQLYSDAWFTAARTGKYSPGGGVYERQEYLAWQGSLIELAVYEKIREGRAPQFEIDLNGELCYLLKSSHPFLTHRTEPQRFFSHQGNARITYPKEVWTKMLERLGIAENVLVEIPLPGNPSPQWDPVWSALAEAKRFFEQGGSTGWKGCVAAVRLALEKWQDIEKEDMGPGWKSPSMQDRKDRTKKQRFDNLRWHLYQCAHLGAHSSADDWTRDDAILLLSTLAALLAERKP